MKEATLSHRQARRYLQQRLDGPLPAAQQARLQQHLDRCPACRAYAADAARFHHQLAQTLPALWPARPATPARLARAAHRAAQRRAAAPPRSRFAAPARAVLQLAVLLLLAGAAFWYFDRPPAGPQDGAPEDAAFVDPAFPNAELAAGALAVRFDFDFNRLPGGKIDLYVPACDGVEFVPSASALFHKLNLGQPLPQCALQPSDTILLAPGATQQVLLVYRNPSVSAVGFRLEPTSRTALSQPFAQALCGGEAGQCLTYHAPPRGIWAKFIPFSAPSSAPPGAHVNVTARVHWTQDAP